MGAQDPQVPRQLLQRAACCRPTAWHHADRKRSGVLIIGSRCVVCIDFVHAHADESTLPEGIPRDYEVNFGLAPPATYIFSHTAPEQLSAAAAATAVANGGAAAAARHEGRVVSKGEIRPKGLDEDYRSLVRERYEKADMKTRQVGIVEDEELLKKPSLNHFGTQQAEKKAKEMRGEKLALAASKRARHVPLSKKELRDKVLELFGQQAYWGKPQLVAAMAIGPKQEGLKACLDEVCVKITQRGPHYNDYQLKPELSGRASATSKARAEL